MRKSGEKFTLLDCREPGEYQTAHIEGSTLIPMREISGRLAELEPLKAERIVVHCHHGGRSMISFAGLVGCLYTEYWPITRSKELLNEAAVEKRFATAAALYDQAVAADPYSADVKNRRAGFYYSVWQYHGQTQQYWEPFEKAMMLPFVSVVQAYFC